MDDLPREFKLTGQDKQTFDAIRACLSDDFLTPEEREKIRPDSHPVTGHCFIATHAAYHLIGARHNLQPYFCKLSGGGTHWWLWNNKTGEYLDPTHEQAAQPFPYNKGQKNLLYIRKHNRTNELLSKVNAYLNNQTPVNTGQNCQPASAATRSNARRKKCAPKIPLADKIQNYQDKFAEIETRKIFWMAFCAWCVLALLGGMLNGYGDSFEHNIQFNVDEYSGRISEAYDHARAMQSLGFIIMLLATVCYLVACVASFKTKKIKRDCLLLIGIPIIAIFAFDEKPNYQGSIALAFSMPIVLSIILVGIFGAKLPIGGKSKSNQTNSTKMTADSKNSEKIIKTKWADNGCPANTEITILGRDSKAETSMGAHKIRVKDKKGNEFTIDWANTRE